MVENFIIPDDVIIPNTDKDPAEEHKLQLQKEKRELDDLCDGVQKILENPKVIEACKDWALFIKENQKGIDNLYLGYALDTHNKKLFGFFKSLDKNKDSEQKQDIISKKSVFPEMDIKIRIKDQLEIPTYKILYDLVLRAITKKYAKKTTDETEKNLNETFK